MSSSILPLADLVLRFGLVNRATMHQDGRTWESDTTHTVMLAVVACAIVAEHPELGLDIGLVCQLAVVHDLVEAHVGDTDTFSGGLSAAEVEQHRREKAARERAALERIEAECAAWPWLAATITLYEQQQAPEARFVRYADKLLPRATNALNGGAAIRRRGREKAESFAHDRRLIDGLAVRYPEFAPVLDPLLRALCDESERTWRHP